VKLQTTDMIFQYKIPKKHPQKNTSKITQIVEIATAEYFN